MKCFLSVPFLKHWEYIENITKYTHVIAALRKELVGIEALERLAKKEIKKRKENVFFHLFSPYSNEQQDPAALLHPEYSELLVSLNTC